MQQWPLLIPKLIDHAAAYYGGREVVSQTVEGTAVRSNWRTISERARALARWLVAQGVGPGDRVATLACNTSRHLETWFGVCGAGAVVHTVNPRLFPEQISFILNHAEDRVLFLDATYVPLIEQLIDRLPRMRLVVLTDAAHMPRSTLALDCYEDLLAETDLDFEWVAVSEDDPAGLCYTSGTTGDPKGVLYSHRSNILQSWSACMPDGFAMSSRTCALPIVPLFHANAWSLPFASALTGAKLVLGGPNNDAAWLQKLIVDEGVTLTAAVPTIWLNMLQYLDATGRDLGPLERVVIGGAAVPRSIIERFERDFGVSVIHAWGMTETSPLGSICTLCPVAAKSDPETLLDYKAKQGRAPFGVEMIVTDNEGRPLPRDGATSGHLKVRGAWVIDRYFGSEASALDEDGWFDTGDIATIDPLGYMQITDRAKDVVKSGGEWISSIDLENAAVGCVGVSEAAVIGVPHPKWGERPLLICVREGGSAVEADDIRAFLSSRVAKWWVPDEIVFVDCLPHTATGKIQKTKLREQFRGRVLA